MNFRKSPRLEASIQQIVPLGHSKWYSAWSDFFLHSGVGGCPKILQQEYSSGRSGSFLSNMCHYSSLPKPKILTQKNLVHKSLQHMRTCLWYCAFKLMWPINLMHTEDHTSWNGLTFVPKPTLVQITSGVSVALK